VPSGKRKNKIWNLERRLPSPSNVNRGLGVGESFEEMQSQSGTKGKSLDKIQENPTHRTAGYKWSNNGPFSGETYVKPGIGE